MSNHTAGPWEATFTDCRGGPANYCRIRPKSGEMFGYYTSMEIATMNMMDEAEQQANARLIASAPELLDALRLIASAKDRDFGIDYAIGCAKAAIGKATGEEQ